MQKSQLIFLYHSLSSKEIKAFKLWLSSPSHNKSPLVQSLFEWLEQQKSGEQVYVRHEAFQYLFPHKRFDDAKLRLLMFQLFRCMQAFLIDQDYQQKPIRRQIHLASIYRQRGLDKLFGQTIKNVKQKQQEQALRDADYYDREFQLYKEENAFIEKQGRTLPMSLQEIGDALEISFIIKKLWQSCLTISHQKVYKADYQTGMLPLVLEYIEQKEVLKIPAVAIYYYCYKALSEQENKAHFTQFKDLMVRHQSLFTAPESIA